MMISIALMALSTSEIKKKYLCWTIQLHHQKIEVCTCLKGWIIETKSQRERQFVEYMQSMEPIKLDRV